MKKLCNFLKSEKDNLMESLCFFFHWTIYISSGSAYPEEFSVSVYPEFVFIFSVTPELTNSRAGFGFYGFVFHCNPRSE